MTEKEKTMAKRLEESMPKLTGEAMAAMAAYGEGMAAGLELAQKAQAGQ
ncbi:hypothetical protein [Vermiculatibacterium agrestimuris]|nr:hypothetical protein [Vermiculatibacterium agrestimuris]